MAGILELQEFLEEAAMFSFERALNDSNLRFLEDESSSSSSSSGENQDSSSNSTSTSQLSDGNDSQVLKDTLRVYGSFFALALIAFCYLRRKFPRVYNLRNWVEELQTELADHQQGFLSWMWRLCFITDTEMLDECGMDALCYLRVLEFGFKLALAGVLQAAWLIPVYKTAKESPETDYITDPVVSISVSNLPSGSYRFIATVVCSYIIFGFTMYNILQEFEWFIMFRHRFLSKRIPRNYCVYVQCIPQEYRSSRKLLEFFEQASAQGVVLEAQLALSTPNLSKKVREREYILRKLEHAINLEEVRGVTPMRSAGIFAQPVRMIDTTLRTTRIVGSLASPVGRTLRHAGLVGPQMNLIDSLFEKLQNSNKVISELIEKIQLKASGLRYGVDEEFGRTWEPGDEQCNGGEGESTNIMSYLPPLVQTNASSEEENEGEAADHISSITMEAHFSEPPYQDPLASPVTEAAATTSPISQHYSIFSFVNSAKVGATWAAGQAREKVSQAANTAMSTAVLAASTAKTTAALAAHTAKETATLAATAVKETATLAATAATAATQTAAQAAQQAMKLLLQEDGEPLSAGFVTFKTLRSAQAALQMVQYSEPFAMKVLEAPQPEDVLWRNVGRTHKELQLGMLLSFGSTTALCLFWTIPMSFISSLSTIQGLREVPFVNQMLETSPWLEPVLAQLAPLLIVFANQGLKMLLEFVSRLEGPVSGAVIQASLFSKLAAFMLIQTFFVTAISGTLLSSLSSYIQEPAQIINVLANNLPTQSTFFIQILLVDTFVAMSIELLRVPAVVLASIRYFVGPNLTEKERQTTWHGLRPLSDPFEFEHADVLASTVLYFMVYFVYAAIAPITTFFMALCFLLLGIGYRHQFVYIYPTFPDSGGKLWVAFFKIIPTCMLIAEITICGMLSLKKSPVAVAMMVPLIVITILFTFYIHQEHFKVTEHLPSRDCIKTDLKNSAEHEMNFDFLHGQYIQPELRNKELYPENATLEREIAQGCVTFETPMSSMNFDDQSSARPTDGE